MKSQCSAQPGVDFEGQTQLGEFEWNAHRSAGVFLDSA
jgi:hypothetical protein